MNIGDALFVQNIALFDRMEVEEALMLSRYFLYKAKSSEQRTSYLQLIDRLERRLLDLYAAEGNRQPPVLPDKQNFEPVPET